MILGHFHYALSRRRKHTERSEIRVNHQASPCSDIFTSLNVKHISVFLVWRNSYLRTPSMCYMQESQWKCMKMDQIQISSTEKLAAESPIYVLTWKCQSWKSSTSPVSLIGKNFAILAARMKWINGNSWTWINIAEKDQLPITEMLMWFLLPSSKPIRWGIL